MSDSLTAQQLTELPNCSLWRRLAAILYDSLLLAAVLLFATAVAMAVAMVVTGDAQALEGSFLMSFWLLLVSYGFFAGFWIHGGQTLGMRAWRLRVIDQQGNPITLWQALLRFLVAIPSVGLGVGLLWSLFDHDHLTWHDRYSMTRTVVLPKKGSKQGG